MIGSIAAAGRHCSTNYCYCFAVQVFRLDRLQTPFAAKAAPARLNTVFLEMPQIDRDAYIRSDNQNQGQ